MPTVLRKPSRIDLLGGNEEEEREIEEAEQDARKSLLDIVNALVNNNAPGYYINPDFELVWENNEARQHCRCKFSLTIT